MARDIYYQSVGNPLQVDRLESVRSDVHLPYHPYTPAQDARYAIRLIFLFCLLGVACIFAQLMHVEAAHAMAARSMMWTNIILVCIAAYLIGKSVRERDGWWLGLPLGCLFAAFVFLNVPLSLRVHSVLAAVSLGVFNWYFGIHWTYQCTTSPMKRTDAEQLRRSWTGYLTLISLVPTIVIVLFLTLPLLLASCILMAIVLFQVLEASRRSRCVPFKKAWNALVSWLSYNRDDAKTPSIFRSPAGNLRHRITMTGACVLLVSTIYVRLPIEIAITFFSSESIGQTNSFVETSLQDLEPPTSSNVFDGAAIALASVAVALVLPAIATLFTPMVLSLPVIAEATKYRNTRVDHSNWNNLIEDLGSHDPNERGSLFMGRLAHDGSPLLVPQTVFHEHAHFLGDSGSGKTSLGLAPFLEQIISRGDVSVVVLDLKADSMELLGTLQAAARVGRQRSKRTIPVKHFSNQIRKSTFAFNPLLQPFWQQLELFMRTDIQCGALGLTYGADYGEGYYSSANSAVLHHTIKNFPDVLSYRELADRVGEVVENADKSELHPEIRKAGIHVQTVLDRLGSCEALNVAPNAGYPADVVDQMIDFTQVFSEPQINYFHLSSTLAPGSSPEIARLVAYSLLAAATQVKRKHQVFLVIDEFQRMVARNIEYMLQLARSMGVGVILANQSMQDLQTRTANLIPPIESNCRYRQWFAVSSLEDRQRLSQGSGETVDYDISRTYRSTQRGVTESVTYNERIVPRLSENDILLASDHQKQSIVRISRGERYAQYGGFPFVVEADYHIHEDEYENRKATAWPTGVPGSFIPPLKPHGPKAPKPMGPQVTTEVIGTGGMSDQAANLFNSFMQSAPNQSGRSQRKPKK